MAKARRNSDGSFDTRHETRLYCPHCGEEVEDAWDYQGGDGYECYKCGEEYSFEREMVAYYTSTKPEKKGPVNEISSMPAL